MDNTEKPFPPVKEEDNEYGELISSLPKDTRLDLTLYKDFWYPSRFIPALIYFQRHFEAHDEDILLASQPKSGTTWLKALGFMIINRAKYTMSENPLLNSNPQTLVFNLEMGLIYAKHLSPDPLDVPPPRLFSTHMPYVSMPDTVKNTKCRLVYLCRNPLDTLVSYWHFKSNFGGEHKIKVSADEYAEYFAGGVSYYGPFWDHVLSYWNESLKNPNKVLFLKYEDMKENPVPHVKKMAEFLGYPFSEQEESDGIVDQLIHLCSFDNLKNLEVNKNGTFGGLVGNKAFFRKGQVGDWNKSLSDSSVEHVKHVVQEKLSGSGLDFKLS